MEAADRPPHPLRALRESRGLTQERFAQLIDRDVSTVKRWESGRTSPGAAARQALAEALQITVAELGFGTGDDDVMELTRRAARSSVGEATLDELEQSIDRLAHAYAATDPADLLPVVLQRMRFTVGLLEGKTTLDQHRRLLVAGGWSSLLVAALCFDQGEREAAHAARAAAHSFARESGDAGLAAWAFEAAAWFALAEGRFLQAIDAGRAGQEVAPSGSPALAANAAQEGRACARVGEGARSGTAFARAAAILESDSDGRNGGHFTIDGPTLSFYATTAHVWLGRPREAEAEAVRVLRDNGNPSVGNHWPTRVATVQVERALARVQQGDLDEAAALGSSALDGAFLRRSTLWRAAELDAALGAASNPQVREFRERFAARSGSVAPARPP